MRVTRTASAPKHWTLKPGKHYIVVGISESMYRIVADNGGPYLYEKDEFLVVDGFVPTNWVFSDLGDGEYRVQPPKVSARHFYEDFFDHEPAAVSIFPVVWRGLVLDEMLARPVAECRIPAAEQAMRDSLSGTGKKPARE